MSEGGATGEVRKEFTARTRKVESAGFVRYNDIIIEPVVEPFSKHRH